MFDSGIKAQTLFKEIENEADIAIDVGNTYFVSWLNTLEQMLYSEIIKEQAEHTFTSAGNAKLQSITVTGDNVRYEDVHAVYADGLQLKETTLASGAVFPNTYFKKANDIAFSDDVTGKTIKIIYIVRPKIKTTSNMSTENVKLPTEFVELAKAKLRGEAYKLANEDGLSAKWLGDYNVLLETFKVWIQNKSPSFGI